MILLLASLPGRVGAVGGPAITGDWWRTDGALRINISACGERLCAVNTWTRDAGGSNAVGDRMILSLAPREPTTLAGEAFDEKRRLTYSISVSVGQDAMTTHGCLVSGMLCRTMSWTRSL